MQSGPAVKCLALNPQLKRLKWLFYFLLAFLAAAIASALATYFKTGWGFTIFEANGIATGPGTALTLIVAALAALLVFVRLKINSAEHVSDEIHLSAHEIAMRDQWLCADVLGRKTVPVPEWGQIDGSYRERKARIERLPKSFRFSVEVHTPLDLKVWRRGENQTVSAQVAPYPTNDPFFERHCDWSSATPELAWKLLLRPGTTAWLNHLTFSCAGVSGEGVQPSVLLGNGALCCSISAHENADFFLWLLHNLCQLADACENPNSPPHPKRSASPFYFMLSCLAFTGFLLVPLAILWTGGAYFVAKGLGLAAGMACFFSPLLLLALFVFTRSEYSRSRESLEEFDALERELHSNPQFAELLKRYHARLGDS